MPIRIARICRYPVKGLSCEPLTRVVLTPGECLPQDRRFALARAGTRFDPQHPEWLPKSNFVMLMREEKLAELQTRFDEDSGCLTIERNGRMLLSARITDRSGCESVSGFFRAFLGTAPDGVPRLVQARGHTFSNASKKPNSTTWQYVSIVNLETIRALEQAAGVSLDPIRFRANFYIDGAAAWSEFDWVGSGLDLGGARLHVVSRIVRCAATAVNPATAVRDVDVPAILQRAFGHTHLGVYAEVSRGGEVVVGDAAVPDGASMGVRAC